MTGRLYYCPVCGEHMGEERTGGEYCEQCGHEVELV